MIEAWLGTGAGAAIAGMLIALAAGVGTALAVIRTGKEKKEDLKAEIGTLEKSLEGMHQEASVLRRETSDLRRMSEEADRIRSEHAALGKRKEEVEAWAWEEVRKLDEIEAKRRASRSAENEAARLRDEVAALQARKARLDGDLEDAEEIRKKTMEAKDVLDATKGKLRAAELELESVLNKAEAAKRAREAAERERVEAEDEQNKAEERCRETMNTAARAEETKREATEILAGLQQKVEEMRGEVSDLTGGRDELRSQIGAAERRVAELKEEEDGLKNRRDSLKEYLEQLRDTAGGSVSSDPSANRLGNLTEPPHLRYQRMAVAAPRTEEGEKLEQAIEAIKKQGLNFRDRVVHRFHTALKVSRISPLTVLAGISGTGKTQLPRAYAWAMGMERLVVPVQPRWDGPRDLLGHFDFLHRRFQATDLARLLCDYTQTDPDGEAGEYRLENNDDRMAIVLLDEMNLARTEYYFSEFLSRLELQGKQDEQTGDAIDKDRMVELDIPYLEEKDAVRVFPTQRILWVGTMNEDESTMTLSDKVIDRANILRFARPTDMGRQNGAKAALGEGDAAPNGHLSANDWNDWCMEAKDIGRTEDLIEQVNMDVMEPCGRSFGHRMREAMVKYVEVYTGRGWAEGFADQIEMRLLPKLQGVDAQMDKAGNAIARLAQICDEELNDSDLAESIRQARMEMEQTGTFNWKGRELPNP